MSQEEVCMNLYDDHCQESLGHLFIDSGLLGLDMKYFCWGFVLGDDLYFDYVWLQNSEIENIVYCFPPPSILKCLLLKWS